MLSHIAGASVRAKRKVTERGERRARGDVGRRRRRCRRECLECPDAALNGERRGMPALKHWWECDSVRRVVCVRGVAVAARLVVVGKCRVELELKARDLRGHRVRGCICV